MEKVIKVNIGNIAFTLGQSAHDRLKEYLDALSDYYSNNTNRNEILSGIEERIAELLLEKGFEKDIVIDAASVEEVLTVIGRPEDFGDGEDGPASKFVSGNRKRLYRDMENARMRGVCSGLGEYFSIDPVFIRIMWASIVTLGLILSVSVDEAFIWLSLVPAILYLIACKSMPVAKTLDDKIRMHGSYANLKDIENKAGQGIPSERGIPSRKWGSGFVRILGLVAGIFLFIIGISGCAAILFALIGIGAFNIFSSFGLSEFLSVMSGQPHWVSAVAMVFSVLLCALPFIGMLYAGILLSFNLHAPKWRPGLIIFLLWLVSIAVLSIMSVSMFRSVRSVEYRTQTETVVPTDTLYIEFEGYSGWQGSQVGIEASHWGYNLMFYDKESDIPVLVFYPELDVTRSDECSMYEFVFREGYLPAGFWNDDLSFNDLNRFWSMDGNVIRLRPLVVSELESLKSVKREVRLYVGENTAVIVRDPVYHQFDSRYRYHSSKIMETIMDIYY